MCFASRSISYKELNILNLMIHFHQMMLCIEIFVNTKTVLMMVSKMKY